VPTVIPFVFAPEDEKQFCAFVAPFALTVYPDRVPAGWQPFLLDTSTQDRLDGPGYYLAAERLADVQLRLVKRGKDKGTQEIDETASPVLHYLRSQFESEGQLRSGRLWCELNLSGDMQRNPAFPDAFRRMLVQVREFLQTRCHRSSPAGFLVGPQAARLWKAGTPLREEGRKGGLLKPYK
jgi:hypothetical protein